MVITVDIRDSIEEFGELEQNFNRMAAELKANEYLRKDFISNVSHELRTPLSIVRGYAELLAEGGLSEAEQREYARYIVRETERRLGNPVPPTADLLEEYGATMLVKHKLSQLESLGKISSV